MVESHTHDRLWQQVAQPGKDKAVNKYTLHDFGDFKNEETEKQTHSLSYLCEKSQCGIYRTLFFICPVCC